MNWIWLAIKVSLLWLYRWLTVDKEKRAAGKETVKEVKDAIKDKDPSRITAAFDRANRLR